MALTNCLLDTRHDGHLWQSHMVMDDLSLSTPLSDLDLASWRDALLRGVFAEHLTPLWHVLSARVRHLVADFVGEYRCTAVFSV